MASIRSRRTLSEIAACVLLLALIWIASFHLTSLRRADHELDLAFYDLTYRYYPAHPNAAFSFLVSICDPWPYLLLGGLVIAFALARRQLHAAWAAGIVLIGANLTTLALKALVPEPHAAALLVGVPRVPYPRWPSGHTTAAMALAVSVVLVAPARLRLASAAAGGAFAALVAVGVLVLGSHQPSDVLGAFPVAAGWSLLAVTAWLADEPRVLPRRRRPGQTLAVGLFLSLALFAVALVLVGPHAIVSYAGGNGRFVAAALGIAAVAAANCSAVAVALSRATCSPPRG